MTDTKAAHTQEQWSINSWPQPDAEIRIGAPGTPLIATVNLRDVSINEQLANAKLIVKACNNYDKLVAALHETNDLLKDVWEQSADYLSDQSGEYFDMKKRMETIERGFYDI